MRVLLSAFACEPGRGSEQEVGWKWAVELARSGELERVVVLTQERNREGIERWIQRPEFADLPLEFHYFQFPAWIHRLKSRHDFLTMPYYAAWQVLALRRARVLHREQPFDLVHHLTFATFRIPVWMKHLGIPVVMGPVGGAETAPWKLLKHRARPGVFLREALRNILTGAGEWTQRAFPPLCRGWGICLASTPRMRAIFEKLGQPVALLPTVGVDLDPASLPERREDRPARRFLFVGRLHFLKGLQLLLDAMKRVEVPGITLTIVGDGAELEPLKAQAAALGIDGQVRFLGRIAREDLKAIYREHDVLCAPSLYESGGLAALEGMENGLPAIVLDVGGHSVSVAPGCGTKVGVGAGAEVVIDELAQAITRYATDGRLLQEHSLAAKQRVREAYAWEVKTRAMLEVYRGVLDRKRSTNEIAHALA